MVSESSPDTDELLDQAHSGDRRAVDQLLGRHRTKLRQMIAARLDARIATRVDPSDVVQEVVLEAYRQLPNFLEERPLPFYPWLRRIAWRRLVDLHRRHIQADKRSVRREEQLELPDHSALLLANRLAASATSPSGRAVASEAREAVRHLIAQMSSNDREVLVLMYLEQLSTPEVSAVLGISESAATMRHLRALDRLRRMLEA